MGDVSDSGERGTEGGGTAQDTGPAIIQESATEPATSQEGARELNATHEEASDQGPSQESAREPSTRQEGAIDANTTQEGTREPSTEGTEDTSQEGTEDTSQEGTEEPSMNQEDIVNLNTSQEGMEEASSIQVGTKDHEASVGQENARDPSAGHIEDTEPKKAIGEDGEELAASSSHDPSEPHNETEEYTMTLKEDEREMTEKTDQEPSPIPKEEPEPPPEQGEEEEEADQDQDQDQDPELQEEVDEQIREELLQQYHALAQERDKIQQQNSQLQNKLYEYFRKKKGEETRPETTKNVTDQEQRYVKNLSTLEEMRRQYKEEEALHQQQIEELRVQCQDNVSKVDKEWTAFQEQKKKIILSSVSKRGGGRNAPSSLIQEIDLLQSKEERKEKEVIQVRLENIKLKNQINRYDSTLRSKEELADGLHLIDFEQLKIENQTYNEKIEERNEELQKLRKKITSTVQVLTHVKEKLQYVQAENHEQKEKLMEIEAVVGNKRDILTKTKQARDSLRMDNLKLKQKSGLLGNKVLLRDFEDKVDATEELRQTLEHLKRRHADLTLSSKGLMKKIDETKLVMEE